MAKTIKIKNGKILIYQEIDITDYAIFLKYDWHLYNLPKDIQNAKDASFRRYLKAARDVFATETDNSRPNKRIDLFGTHSVFYYLYGHTKEWVAEARINVDLNKDLLTCIFGNNLDKTLDIIQRAESLTEAIGAVCSIFGIKPSSAERIYSMTTKRLLNITEEQQETKIETAEAFLQKITKLAEYDSSGQND